MNTKKIFSKFNFCGAALLCAVQVGFSAHAMPNLTCEYAPTVNPYRVLFSVQTQTAQVKNYFEPIEFSDLKCTYTQKHEGLVYRCLSPVADAGFKVEIFWEQGEDFTADLYQISLKGEEFLATLPCFSNM